MRFVGHLSDRQFIRLDNFHVLRILDTRRSVLATAATRAEVFTPVHLCVGVRTYAYYTWSVSDHDVPHFARVLHACISAQTSLSLLCLVHTAIYLKREGEREGDRLMCSKNLLPSSQYYNYFISGLLIMFLFMGEQ